MVHHGVAKTHADREPDWNEYWKSEKPFTDKEAYKIINTWKPSRTWPGFRGSPSDPHWAHRWHQYFAELNLGNLTNITQAEII